MKFILSFAIVVYSMVLYAQTTIPNAGFENWTTQRSYTNPDGWDSPNEVSSSLGIAVVEPEGTIKYEGNYSAKISVKSSLVGALPGVLTTADFDFNLGTLTATIAGGTPFTGRPERFSGWFQYSPNNNDECFFGAILLKDLGNGNYDTVGSAGFFSSQTLLSWTYFDTVFDYRTSDTPTHLNILLLPTNQNNPQVNSVVLVDALQLHYGNSSISESESMCVKVYNDGSYIHFPMLGNEEKLINIYNMNGQLVSENRQSENKLSIQHLDKGMYIVRIQDDKAIYNGKFVR